MSISLVDSLGGDIDALRDSLRSLRSPSLDLLRAEVGSTPTSGLLTALMMTSAGQIPLTPEEKKLQPYEIERIAAAIMLALGDEIDRRIPIPK